jgi:cephalosporin-C deacetylase-like acetyl esterase
MHISHSSVYKTLANAIKSRPESANAILDTLCLFDPLRHADRITIPVALSAGGKDPASPASTIEPVYDAIASTIKQYRFFPKSGHVFLPEMMQTYIEWIAQFVCDGNRHGNG